MKPIRHLLLAAGVVLPLLAGATDAGDATPNPWLADSSYPITHVDPAQSGAVAVAGPRGPDRALGDTDIAYRFMGPGHLIQVISGPYPDGRRVIWSGGVDRLVKQDYASFDIVDTLMWREDSPYTEDWAEDAERALDAAGGGVPGIWRAVREMYHLNEGGGLYPLVDRDNRFHVIHGNAIEVYGDAEPGNAGSPIELLQRFERPEDAHGRFVGMNYTWDGWLVVVTEGGDLFALTPDFRRRHRTRLEGAPARSEDSDQLSGWIRNSFAIGDDGGIYIVSRDFMHRVQWTGDGFSQDPADGAWREPYPNGLGSGSGSTPTLMGYGDDADRFVVITDGDALMQLTLFWRDAIPADWQGLPGLPRRIAARAPVNMDDPALAAVQSEQSVGVLGYGALVVNNEPRNVPWYVPHRMRSVLVGLLATQRDYHPLGVQKFAWDPAARVLRTAWVNREVSSPNSVPLISAGSALVYTEGVRDGKWTLEALDWESGASRFHWTLPRLRHNTQFAPVVLDPDGRPMWGSTWGRLRLQPLEDAR